MSDGLAFTPLYRFTNGVGGTTIIEALEIEGWFVDPEEDEPDEFVIFGRMVNPEGLSDESPGNVVMDVLDATGGDMGGYDIGSMVVSRVESSDIPGVDRIGGTFFGHTAPFAGAGLFYRRLATGVPVRSGEWMEYPGEWHRSWLHTVQKRWSGGGRSGDWPVCVMDGRRIVGEASFYCAIGEAVSGPGKYFGSNLNALDDCLMMSVHGVPFELVWTDFAASARRIDPFEVEIAIDILIEYDITVTLR
ncbi:barstar family protein [Stackebrandtia soli]|uniref:barstar family protein n=1 Tax=Stackebrandtia soli TaxID=1892856 RepID=UPI0039EC21CD